MPAERHRLDKAPRALLSKCRKLLGLHPDLPKLAKRSTHELMLDLKEMARMKKEHAASEERIKKLKRERDTELV